MDVVFYNEGEYQEEAPSVQAGEEVNTAAQQGLDISVQPDQVISRIEELVTEFISCLERGSIMGLRLMPMANNFNCRAATDLASAAAAETTSLQQQSLPLPPGSRPPAAATARLDPTLVAAVAGRPQIRSLCSNNGAGAMAYARVFLVLQAVHELLVHGRTATQRDLYYKLQRPPVIASSKDIDAAIQDLSRILAVPRAALGVTCASRGAVVGRVYIRDTPASPWQDCTLCGTGGKAIPGDLNAIDNISFQTSASYLLIIEKDAVFQRLSQDRLFDALPVIMVTARGHPDLATRAFCSRLVNNFQLTVLGFVDFNPAGVIILRTYKFGSQRSGLESPRYAMPDLQWLGLHSSWLTDVTTDHLQQLTPRDRSLLPNLKSSFQPEAQAGIQEEQGEQLERWVAELDVMEELGYKADIEAVYSVGGYAGLKDMVVQAVLRKQYF